MDRSSNSKFAARIRFHLGARPIWQFYPLYYDPAGGQMGTFTCRYLWKVKSGNPDVALSRVSGARVFSLHKATRKKAEEKRDEGNAVVQGAAAIAAWHLAEIVHRAASRTNYPSVLQDLCTVAECFT